MVDRLEELEKIRQKIDKISEKDAEAIISAAEKKAEEIVSEEKKLIEQELKEQSLKEISRFELSERKRVSEKCFAAERKALLRRDELVNGLFAEIEEELLQYCKKSEYRGYILRSAEEADEKEKITEDVTVYCKASDLGLVKELMKAYPVKVEADGGIKIGGIILKYSEKRTYIDLTFDTKLSEEREKFAATAEMQL